MSKEIEALTVLLTARTADFEKAMASGERQMDRLEKKMRGSTAVIERDVSRMAAKVSDSFDKVGAAFNIGGAAIGGISLAALAREAVQYSDAWTTAGNSLKVAGVAASRQKSVMDALFASAQQNSTEVGALADVFGKASTNAKELGADEAKLLRFTDGVAVAVKAAGKSTSESSGALLQLGQLLGAGTVRAEEFNSVLEGAPTILTAVAAGMEGAGGSVAALRAMVLAGEVSSRAFFDAFLKGKPVIDDMAAKALPTVGNAVTRVNNALTQYVGENAQAQGATRALIGGLNFLADHFDETSDVALQFAGVIAAALVGRSIAGMIVALGGGTRALTGFVKALAAARTAGGVAAMASAAGGLAAAAGPVGAILGVAAAAGLYWASSGREAAASTDKAASSAERYAEALKRVKGAAPEAADAAKASAGRFVETERNRLSGQLNEDTKAAQEAAAAVQKYLDTIIQTAPRRLISNEQLAQLGRLRDRVGVSVDAAVELQEAIARLANTDPKFQRMKDQLQPLLDALIARREAARQAGEELDAIGQTATSRISRGEAAQGEAQRAADRTLAVDDVATKAEVDAAKSDREKAIEKQTEKLVKEYQDTGRKIDEAVRQALRDRATGIVNSAEDRDEARKRMEGGAGGAARKLIVGKEGFSPTAYTDWSRDGSGRRIDTGLAIGYGTHVFDGRKVQSGDRVSREQADAELDKRIEGYFSRLRDRLGSAFDDLGDEQKGVLASLEHNYGTVPSRVSSLIKQGVSTPEVADAIRRLGSDNAGVNRARRAEEADIYAGGATAAQKTVDKQIDFAKDSARDNARKVEDINAETEALNRKTEALARGAKEQEYFDAQALRSKFISEEKRKLEDQQIALTDERISVINREADAYVAAEQRKFDAARRADEAEKGVRRSSEAVKDAKMFVAEGATDAFTGIVTGANTAKEAVDNLVKSLLEASIKALLLGQGPLAGVFGTAAGGGMSGGLLGGLLGFGGGKADGGRVSKGQVYEVGERGRELFAPGENGRIIPSSAIRPDMGRIRARSPSPVVSPSVRMSVTVAGPMGDKDLVAAMERTANVAGQRAYAQAVRTGQQDWPAQRKYRDQLKD